MVSMDLSKAFDTQPHDLIVSKLRAYGADDGTVDLIRDYLTDRQQRGKNWWSVLFLGIYLQRYSPGVSCLQQNKKDATTTNS